MILGDNLLKRLAEGDREAAAHLRDILRTGVIEKDDAAGILGHAVQGMARQSARRTEGLLAKFELYSIVSELCCIVVPPSGGMEQDLMKAAANVLSVDDRDITTVSLYEDLVALAMNGPEGCYDKVPKQMAQAAKSTAGGSFRQTISTGAAIARAREGSIEVDGTYLEAARVCLLNAMHYGSPETSTYAYEAVSLIPDNKASDYLLDAAWGTEGESRAKALGALFAHYGDDTVALYTISILAKENLDVRAEVAQIAKGNEAAGRIMAGLRHGDELDTARADKEMLLETEYPDPTCPQRTYIEMVFNAVETALSPAGGGRGVDYETSVKQLATWGADPGGMADLFDKHSLKLIRRNVENALLHVLATHPDCGVREEAAAGLKKIGSDRVEAVLERIVERLGEGCPAGALASDTLASIRGSKVEIFEVVLPAPAKRKPPAQPPRLVQ
ncbi:MAG: hypothetical protein AB1529_02855 [Candidatus Micrarchaeota archaeon]